MKKKSILGEFMNNEAKKLGFDTKSPTFIIQK